jgi:hypothetical protein
MLYSGPAVYVCVCVTLPSLRGTYLQAAFVSWEPAAARNCQLLTPFGSESSRFHSLPQRMNSSQTREK